MMPTPGVERLGRLMYSYDKINHVTSGPPNTTPQGESTAQGQECELSDNITQLRQPLTNEEEKTVPQEKVTSESNCGQDVSQQKCYFKEVTQTILQEGHPEREHVGRGWNVAVVAPDDIMDTGRRGTSRDPVTGILLEALATVEEDTELEREGLGIITEGGGAHRGGGRGLHQRVEKEFRKEGVL